MKLSELKAGQRFSAVITGRILDKDNNDILVILDGASMLNRIESNANLTDVKVVAPEPAVGDTLRSTDGTIVYRIVAFYEDWWVTRRVLTDGGMGAPYCNYPESFRDYVRTPKATDT